MDENSCAGQLGLQGGGGGLLPVDVRAVLLHEPVQLLVGDAGDLVLHIFAFHGGNSFQVVRPQFFTLFSVSYPVLGGVRAARRMAPFAGLELAASGFGDRRSSNMS